MATLGTPTVRTSRTVHALAAGVLALGLAACSDGDVQQAADSLSSAAQGAADDITDLGDRFQEAVANAQTHAADVRAGIDAARDEAAGLGENVRGEADAAVTSAQAAADEAEQALEKARADGAEASSQALEDARAKVDAARAELDEVTGRAGAEAGGALTELGSRLATLGQDLTDATQ